MYTILNPNPKPELTLQCSSLPCRREKKPHAQFCLLGWPSSSFPSRISSRVTWALVAQLGNACSRGLGLFDVGLRVMGFMAYCIAVSAKKHGSWVIVSGFLVPVGIS